MFASLKPCLHRAHALSAPLKHPLLSPNTPTPPRKIIDFLVDLAILPVHRTTVHGIIPGGL